VNADQRQLMAAMEAQGWALSAVHEKEAMQIGDKFAIVRGNRTIDVLHGRPDRLAHFCYVQAYKGRGWCDMAVSIATAAAKTSLTSEQFGDILHAIGGGANGYTRPGHRNYYYAGGSVHASLDALVQSGHMVKIRQVGVYRATPKGAAEVGCAGCLDAGYL